MDQEGWWSQEYGLLQALISKISSRKQESSIRLIKRGNNESWAWLGVCWQLGNRHTGMVEERLD